MYHGLHEGFICEAYNLDLINTQFPSVTDFLDNNGIYTGELREKDKALVEQIKANYEGVMTSALFLDEAIRLHNQEK